LLSDLSNQRGITGLRGGLDLRGEIRRQRGVLSEGKSGKIRKRYEEEKLTDFHLGRRGRFHRILRILNGSVSFPGN
jgi:hypothetical protein